jgi:hypothetical protein
MFCRYFLSLPVRSSGFCVIDLEAVHAKITFSGFGVAGGDAGEGDEASGVLRPALQDGKVEEGEVVVLDNFFAGAGGDRLREESSGLGKERKHLQFIEEALRGLDVEKHLDTVGEFVEGVHAQGHLHAGFGAELVDEELVAGVTFYVLEEQGGAAWLYRFVVPTQAKRRLGWGTLFRGDSFADSVCDLRDFKDGIDFGLNAFEFAGAIEGGDPLAEVDEGQRASPGNFRLYRDKFATDLRGCTGIKKQKQNKNLATGAHRVGLLEFGAEHGDYVVGGDYTD